MGRGLCASPFSSVASPSFQSQVRFDISQAKHLQTNKRTAAMDSTDIEDIALRTLLLLEWRLKRLEFLLTGNDTPIQTDSTDYASIPVTKRLHKLEQSLQRLSSQSSTASALLNLRTYTITSSKPFFQSHQQ
jgi:hypothetical protein